MKNFKILGTLLAAGLCFSCAEFNLEDFLSFNYSSQSIASSSESSYNPYKSNDDFLRGETTFINDQHKVENLNMNTLYTNAGHPHLDSMEESRVLVVPFGFTDKNLLSFQNDDFISQIRTTFFGSEEEVRAKGGQYSVKSFYEKSSFGKLNLTGDVLNTWVNYGKTAQEFEADCNGNHGVHASIFIRDWYINEYAKENHGQLGKDAKEFSYYDLNADGFIDLIWIVYAHRSIANTGWWAYVTYLNSRPDYDNPNIKTLGWASLDQLYMNGYGYDAHTFVHETGHTLGLEDYYDYNNKWSPMGKVDMQDYVLGDHCAFSKFSLGWINPLIIDEDCIIELYPTTSTGDCAILPSQNYNYTAFDEYLMVEFIAPVGLNKEDYLNSYGYVYGFSKPGIRISHVDARAYRLDHDNPESNPGEAYYLRLGNSYMGRMSLKTDGDYYLREDGTKSSYYLSGVLENNCEPYSNWTLDYNYIMEDKSLFHEGDYFSLTDSSNHIAETYMPSGKALWNKSKSISHWVGEEQVQVIDESYTIDYDLEVLSIEKDPVHEYKATIKIRV